MEIIKENAKKHMTIRQACMADIPTIEGIFLDVIQWMKRESLENQWNEANTRWEELAKNYKISDFYLCLVEGKPAGCVAVTELDHEYWPELNPGEAWFLHKLAVKRAYAGQYVSSVLITYVCNVAKKNRIPTVRLDCNSERMKLIRLYEREGFQYCRKVVKASGYELSLYCKNII